jgi:hypothetical protein
MTCSLCSPAHGSSRRMTTKSLLHEGIFEPKKRLQNERGTELFSVPEMRLLHTKKRCIGPFYQAAKRFFRVHWKALTRGTKSIV